MFTFLHDAWCGEEKLEVVFLELFGIMTNKKTVIVSFIEWTDQRH